MSEALAELRLQQPGEALVRTTGEWQGPNRVMHTFIHGGLLVPAWLAPFWSELSQYERAPFYLPGDWGLEELHALRAQDFSQPTGTVHIARSLLDFNRDEIDFREADIQGDVRRLPKSQPWDHGAARGNGVFKMLCDVEYDRQQNYPLYGPGVGIAVEDAMRRIEIHRAIIREFNLMAAQGAAHHGCGKVLTVWNHSFDEVCSPSMVGQPGERRPNICVTYNGGNAASLEVAQAYIAAYKRHGFEDVKLDDPIEYSHSVQRAVNANPAVWGLQIEHNKRDLREPGVTQRIFAAQQEAAEEVRGLLLVA